jgi:hypothetical protein
MLIGLELVSAACAYSKLIFQIGLTKMLRQAGANCERIPCIRRALRLP